MMTNAAALSEHGVANVASKPMRQPKGINPVFGVLWIVGVAGAWMLGFAGFQFLVTRLLGR